jgi:hypothetical protein
MVLWATAATAYLFLEAAILPQTSRDMLIQLSGHVGPLSCSAPRQNGISSSANETGGTSAPVRSSDIPSASSASSNGAPSCAGIAVSPFRPPRNSTRLAITSVRYRFFPSCSCHFRVWRRPSTKTALPVIRYLAQFSADTPHTTTSYHSVCSPQTPSAVFRLSLVARRSVQGVREPFV